MPHEGYADFVMNNEPGFHSDVLVIKLTEHITRAIEASDISSTPPVVETANRVTTTKMSRPSTGPRYTWGLEESWTRKETECAVTKC